MVAFVFRIIPLKLMYRVMSEETGVGESCLKLFYLDRWPLWHCPSRRGALQVPEILEMGLIGILRKVNR